jgi:partner of Y14 and mago protein
MRHLKLASGELRVTDTSGKTVIPSSRRADGTVRKAVAVKTGYVPAGERAAYSARGSRNESTSHALRSAGLGGGGSLAQRSGGGRIGGAPKPVKTLSKNAAKRARKRAAAAAGAGGESSASAETSTVDATAATAAAAPAADAAAAQLAPEKQLRKLRKKMKQIAQLEAKVAAGSELNEGQVVKVAAKDEIAAAIASLEALGL